MSKNIKSDLLSLGVSPMTIENQIEDQSLEEKKEFTITFTVCFDSINALEVVIGVGKLGDTLGDTGRYGIARVHAKMCNKMKPSQVVAFNFVFPQMPFFTIHEMFNLFQRRSVYKVNLWFGDAVIHWYVLVENEIGLMSLRRFAEFDIEKTLALYPIEEMNDSVLREGIIISLKRGNKHPITLVTKWSRRKHFMHANPEQNNLILSPFRI